MRRIGIMGGTFNPPHVGHVGMAKAMLDKIELDEVMFVPTGRPPHKEVEGATDEDRLAMLRLATQDNERMSVNPIEINRAGVTYTIDTLRELAQSGDEFVYILGSDTLYDLRYWKDASEVAKLCAFAVALRRGVNNANVHAVANELNDSIGAKIAFVDADPPEASSSTARENAANGLAIGSIVGEKVAEYIYINKLYGTDGFITRDEMLRRLAMYASGKRFRHMLATEECAARLARLHGVDERRVSVAALLHDVAKPMRPDELVERAKLIDPPLDAHRMEVTGLLHGFVGAEIMRGEFDVYDEEILDAVRFHTTARASMTDLMKIVYVADKIDDTRVDQPLYPVSSVRSLAQTDLNAAYALLLEILMKLTRVNGKEVHRDTAEAFENAEFGIRNSNVE